MTRCSHPDCSARVMPPNTLCTRHRPPPDRAAEYARRELLRPYRPDHSKRLTRARRECPQCWVVGGHDPLCKWRTEAPTAARRTRPTTRSLESP